MLQVFAAPAVCHVLGHPVTSSTLSFLMHLSGKLWPLWTQVVIPRSKPSKVHYNAPTFVIWGDSGAHKLSAFELEPLSCCDRAHGSIHTAQPHTKMHLYLCNHTQANTKSILCPCRHRSRGVDEKGSRISSDSAASVKQSIVFQAVKRYENLILVRTQKRHICLFSHCIGLSLVGAQHRVTAQSREDLSAQHLRYCSFRQQNI